MHTEVKSLLYRERNQAISTSDNLVNAASTEVYQLDAPGASGRSAHGVLSILTYPRKLPHADRVAGAYLSVHISITATQSAHQQLTPPNPATIPNHAVISQGMVRHAALLMALASGFISVGTQLNVAIVAASSIIVRGAVIRGVKLIDRVRWPRA